MGTSFGCFVCDFTILSTILASIFLILNVTSIASFFLTLNVASMTGVFVNPPNFT